MRNLARRTSSSIHGCNKFVSCSLFVPMIFRGEIIKYTMTRVLGGSCTRWWSGTVDHLALGFRCNLQKKYTVSPFCEIELIWTESFSINMSYIQLYMSDCHALSKSKSKLLVWKVSHSQGHGNKDVAPVPTMFYNFVENQFLPSFIDKLLTVFFILVYQKYVYCLIQLLAS